MRTSKKGRPPLSLSELVLRGTTRLDDPRLLDQLDRRGARTPEGVARAAWVEVLRRAIRSYQREQA
jgi:hypothetical protein